MIKNDYVFLHLAKRFGFKQGKESVFGAVNGQPVSLTMSQGYTNFSLVFTLNECVIPKVSKDLIKQFNSNVKRAGQVKIENNTVLMKNIYGGFSRDKAVDKLETIINWWTEKLRELNNFDIKDSNDVVLYNDIPGPKDENYKNTLDIKLKRELTQKPVDNYAGFFTGGIFAFTASVLIGLALGVVQHQFKIGIAIIDIVVVLGVSMGIYKKFSNGFNNNSWKYIVPLFLVCLIASQVTHVAVILWYKSGNVDIEKSIIVLLNQFKIWNKYAVIVLIIVAQFIFALFNLKKNPVSVVVEEGTFPTEKDEEWATMTGIANSLVMKYFFFAMVLCLSSILLYTMSVLHDVSFSDYWGHLIILIIAYPANFFLFLKVYKSKISFPPFKRHEMQKKTDFISGHIFVHMVTLFMAFASTNYAMMANVYLDPWGKEEVKGELLENFPEKWNSCKELKVLVPTNKEIKIDFCKAIHETPSKGSQVRLIRGKGLFYINYYKRDKK